MPQYLEYGFALFALLAFVGVACAAVLVLLVKLSRGRGRPTAPTIYPIPPAERGTGQHRSLLDLVDEHIVAEEIARRRRKFSDKLFDFVQDSGPPKA